ncbi:MAG: glycosyltransferase [Muribaculum sp.]|nr:glycosyltransferase [Muribaculum sp.]
MRIIVNDIAASTGGAISVLLEFYQFLLQDEVAKNIHWIFLLSGHYINSTSNIDVRVYPKKKLNWIYRLWFDNIKLRQLCDEFKADGIISLQNTISRSIKLPQLVYVHNVIPFQKEKNFSFFKKSELIYAIYQHVIGRIIRNSVKRADLVVVQAEWLRTLITEKTKINDDKVLVNPISYKVYPNQLEKKVHNSNNTFFYPAFECIYKNQSVIRQACTILEAKGIDAKVYLTVQPQKGESKLIYSIGRISHEEVMDRYTRNVLIFPSYIETVGLPLIEAMSKNAIILAADCQYAHETLSGYSNAYFFNPFSADDLSELIRKVIKEEIVSIKNKKSSISISKWDSVIAEFTSLISRMK